MIVEQIFIIGITLGGGGTEYFAVAASHQTEAICNVVLRFPEAEDVMVCGAGVEALRCIYKNGIATLGGV